MTPDDAAIHECDLFLMSSHHAYAADRALADFARLGERNIDGWGVGGYAGGRARVVRSADPALVPASRSGDLSREFRVAIEAMVSPILVGHLRFTSAGGRRVENNHPFCLSFLGDDWLLVHNGTGRWAGELVAEGDRLLAGSDNDTPRIFEFLRREMIAYAAPNSLHSLIEAGRVAYGRLLDADPRGLFNLILSNGHVSFAFVHWRPFYLLRREKVGGDAALLSTLRLTDHEEWTVFEKGRGKRARMLVFSGPTLLANMHIA